MGRLKRMLSWLSRKKTEAQTAEVFRLYDKDDSHVYFTVSRDIDPDFYKEYYFAIERDRKVQSDIVINIDKDQEALRGLLAFLKMEVKKDETKFYYLNCDCLSDMYRFVRDNDTLYIEYWTFGGQGKKSYRTDMSTQYVKDLAKFLEDELIDVVDKKED